VIHRNTPDWIASHEIRGDGALRELAARTVHDSGHNAGEPHGLWERLGAHGIPAAAMDIVLNDKTPAMVHHGAILTGSNRTTTSLECPEPDGDVGLKARRARGISIMTQTYPIFALGRPDSRTPVRGVRAR
jgi:hypothetical protein